MYHNIPQNINNLYYIFLMIYVTQIQKKQTLLENKGKEWDAERKAHAKKQEMFFLEFHVYVHLSKIFMNFCWIKFKAVVLFLLFVCLLN